MDRSPQACEFIINILILKTGNVCSREVSGLGKVTEPLAIKVGPPPRVSEAKINQCFFFFFFFFFFTTLSKSKPSPCLKKEAPMPNGKGNRLKFGVYK